VAVLIHGGCWRNLPGAGREQLRHIGAELADRGIAVWSIGYRRADEPGGGYPGTFQDVSAAIDRLRSEAPSWNLDLARTVLVGHSAGGHLALWAAHRLLPDDSRLAHPDAFVPGAVISLAGVGDLRAFAPFASAICGPDILKRLTEAGPPHASDVHAEVSPAEMPAPDVPVLMVSGILDRLVPPFAADDYARAMNTKAAAKVELVDLPGTGHFDLVTPGTLAWISVQRAIEGALHIAPAAAGN
jgi:acetyl esterase/lipase